MNYPLIGCPLRTTKTECDDVNSFGVCKWNNFHNKCGFTTSVKDGGGSFLVDEKVNDYVLEDGWDLV